VDEAVVRAADFLAFPADQAGPARFPLDHPRLLPPVHRPQEDEASLKMAG
jgi:hypothetical protein